VAQVAIPEAQVQPLVFYFSLAGATETAANKLGEQLKAQDNSNKWLDPIVHNLTEIDYDDFFITQPKQHDSTTPIQYFYILLIPAYNIDSELSNFMEHLSETHNDFRIDTAPLQTLAGYSVFGFGDKEGWPTEEDGYCSQAIEVDKWMARLTGKRRAYPLGMGDVKSNVKEALEEWQDGVKDIISEIAEGKGLGEGVQGSGDALESDEEVEEEGSEEDDGEETTEKRTKGQRQARLKISRISEDEAIQSCQLILQHMERHRSNRVCRLQKKWFQRHRRHTQRSRNKATRLSVHILVLRSAGGLNQPYAVADHVTSSLSTASNPTSAWRRHRLCHAATNVSFAGDTAQTQ